MSGLRGRAGAPHHAHPGGLTGARVTPRLLLDENLAARLVGLLQHEFLGSLHVRDAIRPAATDAEVWEYARTHDLVIVSKDEDFQRFSVWRGFPRR